MSNEIKKETCDQCGCSIEIGTVISDDDNVYEFSLEGNKEDVISKYNEYVEIAKSADENVQIEMSDKEDTIFVRKGKFVFSCSAEKMIFQLKSDAL